MNRIKGLELHIEAAKDTIRRDYEAKGYTIKFDHRTESGHVVDVVVENKSKRIGFFIVVSDGRKSVGEDKIDGKEEFLAEPSDSHKSHFRMFVHNASSVTIARDAKNHSSETPVQ